MSNSKAESDKCFLGCDEAQAQAQCSIPEENLLATNNAKESVKRLSKTDIESRKRVVITKCLCNPCPRFYTDTLSESLLIECRAMHTSGDGGEQ